MELLVLGIVLLPAVIATAALITARDRWGARRVPIARGEGAYRAAEVGVPEARTIPVRVTVSSIASWTWGAATMFVFVPAGAALLLVASDRGSGAAGGVFMLFVIGIVLSGVAHAIMLFVAGTQVARHHPLAAKTAHSAAVFAWWHHGAVFAGFTMGALLARPEVALAAMALLAIPCGIGALVGASLHAAAKRIEDIDREDATERHRELFVLAPT